MPEGFKIATAYVEVKANVDKTSAEEAGREVGAAADKGAQAGAASGGGGLGSLLIAGIVAAAPIAGAAILAGITFGVVGAAAIIDRNNAQIKASFADLGASASSSLKEAAAPLSGEFVTSLDSMNREMQGLRPQLDVLFAGVRSDIPIVTSGLTQLVQNLLPGMTDAVNTSEPVMLGMSSLLAQTGTAGSDAFTKLSQNSQNFGNVLVMTGSIVHSALDAVINVTSDVGTVMGQNFTGISSVVGGAGRAISGLASGAVPVLGVALGIVTTDVTTVLNVLGPLTPVLGGIGTAAAVAFGGFKLAGLVSSGITSLAGGIVNLGAKVAENAPKLGNWIGDLGIAADTMAGPLGGAVIGVGAALGGLAMIMGQTTVSSQDLSNAQQSLTAAMISSNGQLTAASTGALTQSDAYKTLIPLAQQAGVSQTQLVQAITQGGPAFDNLQNQLQATTNAGVTYSDNGRVATTTSTQAAEAAQGLAQGLTQVRGTYSDAASAAQQAADAQKALAQSAPAASLNTSQLAANMGILKDNTQSSSAQLQAWLANVKLISEGGTQSANDALQGMWTQINTLSSSLKGTSGALLQTNGDFDVTSTKGEAARTAIEAISQQTNTYYQALLNQGMGAQQAAAQADTMANQLVGPVAKALGITRDQAQNLLNTYGAFPSAINTKVTADTSSADNSLSNLINTYDHATITIHTAVTGGGSLTSMLHGSGGIVPTRRASGGVTAVPFAAQFAMPGNMISPDGGQNILGDRPDVREAFIPIDSSAQSRAVLNQTAAAMGMSVGGGGQTVHHNEYQPTFNINGGNPAEITQAVTTDIAWMNTLRRAA